MFDGKVTTKNLSQAIVHFARTIELLRQRALADGGAKWPHQLKRASARAATEMQESRGDPRSKPLTYATRFQRRQVDHRLNIFQSDRFRDNKSFHETNASKYRGI